ncbi:MAG: mechanosensitive ion channel family protein [Reyranella sp.]
MTTLRAAAIAVILLLGMACLGHAQSPAPPTQPQPLPQAQFDALVEAVKKAVAEELKAQTAPAKPAAAGAPEAGNREHRDALDVFGERLLKILAAAPELSAALANLPRALDESHVGGRGTGTFLLLLLAIAAAGLIAEALVRAALARLKLRLASGAAPERGVRSLANLGLLALLDLLPVVALRLVAQSFAGILFPLATLQQRLAYMVVTSLMIWRVYAFILRLIVRPELPAARLCGIDDSEARLLYRRMIAVLLAIIFLRQYERALVAIGTPDDAIVTARLLLGPLAGAVLVWLIVASRTAALQWFSGLGRVSQIGAFISGHWVGLAGSFVVALIATQFYGLVTGHRNVAVALLLTVNLLFGLLLFETLLHAVVRRLDSQVAGFTPARSRPTLADVTARCIRVAVLIGVFVAIAESWVVNVLGLVDASEWDRTAREALTAGITLFVAYVIWEMFRYGTDSYLQRHLSGDAASRASRLGTLIPLLRVTVATVLFVLATLIALENIGVNVTPLLAGASVLGLALSFGSQTLVKDVVSGIFYLTDDAFRVGEFIDCEKAKGTVESFTLRSVRLRNPNGQIHTIPFGELGHVTNFSRDWAAVDFGLRFAREVDLDRLREATRKVSTDIMAVPELSQKLLEPLKMQGIAEVADNALVVRFKFVARPGNPAPLQNEAVTRMLRTFPELGIEFAK